MEERTWSPMNSLLCPAGGACCRLVHSAHVHASPASAHLCTHGAVCTCSQVETLWVCHHRSKTERRQSPWESLAPWFHNHILLSSCPVTPRPYHCAPHDKSINNASVIAQLQTVPGVWEMACTTRCISSAISAKCLSSPIPWCWVVSSGMNMSVYLSATCWRAAGLFLSLSCYK